MNWLAMILSASVMSTPAIAQVPPGDAATRLSEAKLAGWRIANDVVIPKLLPAGPSRNDWPGIAAFVNDYQKVADAIKIGNDSKNTLPFDVDALLAKNPNFWRANYEIAPADPAWMLLHGALLVAAGEVSRAQPILIVARSRSDLPKAYENSIDSLLAQCARVVADGNSEVLKGVDRFDSGDRQRALRFYEEALNVWPQNSWASYEIGVTRLRERMDAIGATSAGAAKRAIQDPEVQTALAESRRHDPFRWKAYQVPGEERTTRVQTIAKAAGRYEKIRISGPSKPPEARELVDFSKELQFVDQDELALVIRQVAIARRSGFLPEDQVFVAKSLRRLVPGKPTDEMLQSLAKPDRKTRKLVELEAKK